MVRAGWMGLVCAGLIVAGCSGHGNKSTSGDSPEPGAAPAGVPTPPANAEFVVKGSVTYRERMALPADAEVYLWIMDVTPDVMIAQMVLTETTVKPLGKQIPIDFELAYDPARIAGDHDYGLRAVIKSGGGEMFTSKEPTLVITKGQPKENVTLVLTRATQ